MDRCACLNEDRAMQAGHPPLILVLHITLCAVTNHDDGQFVLAHTGHFGDVVLAGKSIVGAITNELSIDVHHMHTVGSANV